MLYDTSKQFIAQVIDTFVITEAMESLGQRIKRRREELGLDQIELARKAGFSQPTLANLETGKNQRTKFLPELARELRTSVEWLTSGRGSPEPEGVGGEPYPGVERRAQGRRKDDFGVAAYHIAQSKYRQIPVVGRTIGGIPERIWTDGDYPVGATDQYAEVATQDPNAFLTPVDGHSMAPRFNPGEFALVEPNTEPEIEDDVLVRFRDEGTTLKRLLSRRGGFVRLGSYNGPDIITKPAEDIIWMYYVAHPVPARKIKSRT